MYTKLKLFILLVILVSLLAVGTAAMASGILRPINPSDPVNVAEIGDTLMAAHLTLPPSFVTYTECPQGMVRPPDDRPVAVLGEESAKSAESVSAFFSDLSNVPTDKASEINWTILSSIKYNSVKGDILVTTTKPSAAAAAKSLFLGGREIKLADGVTAWATEYTHGEFPNRVIFIEGELLITVASSLPIDDVERLAADVVVMYP